ncbi:hypothetical protein P4S72_27500 [Vibrio sp. PP-XX7]
MAGSSQQGKPPPELMIFIFNGFSGKNKQGMQMESQDILAKLISFPTISAESNIDLIHYVQGLLTPYGITTQLYFNETQQKASLFASVGPENELGLLFFGHSDVVPVSGQHWTKPRLQR